MRFSGSTGNFAGEFLLLKRPKSLEIRNAAPNPMLPLLGCELALLPSITNPGISIFTFSFEGVPGALRKKLRDPDSVQYWKI